MASLDNFGEKERRDVEWTRDDSYFDDFEAVEDDDDETPIDLTGVVPRGQIRDRYTQALLVDFVAGFVGAPTAGHVFWSLTGTQVDALFGIDAVYDIELDGGDTNRRTVIFGDFVVVQDETRAP